MTESSSSHAWGRWSDLPPTPASQSYYMEMPHEVHSYDPRTTGAHLTRSIVAPHYLPTQVYPGASSHSLPQHPQSSPHSSTYNYGGSYSNGPPSSMGPPYANYVQPRPLQSMMRQASNPNRLGSYPRHNSQGFMEDTQTHPHTSRHPHTSPLKSGAHWGHPSTSSYEEVPVTQKKTEPLVEDQPLIGGTDVDTLMKVVQAKKETSPASTPVAVSCFMYNSHLANEKLILIAS